MRPGSLFVVKYIINRFILYFIYAILYTTSVTQWVNANGEDRGFHSSRGQNIGKYLSTYRHLFLVFIYFTIFFENIFLIGNKSHGRSDR